MLKRVCIVSLTVLVMSLCAFGSTSDQTDWALLPGGTVSWNGLSTGTLNGSGIGVLTVLGFGTPSQNFDLLLVYGGSLSFTSGAYNGSAGAWSWGAGSITVKGCIQGVTTAASVACNSSNDSTVLFTDNFSNISITSSGELVLGQNSGLYNSSLASFFGVPTSLTDTSLDFLLTGTAPGQAITKGSNAGGLFTDGPSVSVPEDWNLSLTLGLFAFALVAFGAAYRFGFLRTVRF